MLLQQLKQPRLSFGHVETAYEDLVFILTLEYHRPFAAWLEAGHNH